MGSGVTLGWNQHTMGLKYTRPPFLSLGKILWMTLHKITQTGGFVRTRMVPRSILPRLDVDDDGFQTWSLMHICHMVGMCPQVEEFFYAYRALVALDIFRSTVFWFAGDGRIRRGSQLVGTRSGHYNSNTLWVFYKRINQVLLNGFRVWPRASMPSVTHLTVSLYPGAEMCGEIEGTWRVQGLLKYASKGPSPRQIELLEGNKESATSSPMSCHFEIPSRQINDFFTKKTSSYELVARPGRQLKW